VEALCNVYVFVPHPILCEDGQRLVEKTLRINTPTRIRIQFPHNPQANRNLFVLEAIKNLKERGRGGGTRNVWDYEGKNR